MNKNLTWKLGLIVILVVFAVLQLKPVWDSEEGKLHLNLKPGIDLAGGTSLIYDIDTQDLDNNERKGIAERMIPMLRKRIDPTNVANIEMNPLGDTRIEIKLPLASTDTKEKRQAFENALEALEKENTNLLVIKKALSKDANTRKATFEKFANGSQQKLDILNTLANAYDQRKTQQDKRDDLAKKLDEVYAKVEKADLSANYLKAMAANWLRLDDAELDKQIDTFLGDEKSEGILESLGELGGGNKGLVKEYLNTYS